MYMDVIMNITVYNSFDYIDYTDLSISLER